MTTLSGVALHTGVPSTVTFAPRPDDGLGIRFLFPGFMTPLTARDLVTLTRSARRATVLTHPKTGAVIRTPEHLLAAALFFADAPIDVTCDADEIPGLDGSAAMYYGVLHALCVANEFSSARACEYDTALTWHHTGREGSLQAQPAPHFSVEYIWESGDIRQHFEWSSALDAPEDVLPARTFILYHDWMKLAGERDLLAGADLDSGLLIATSERQFAEGKKNLPQSCGNEFPLLHPVRFRMDDELARHKVLDLLGDLALNGLALPRLRLTIVNGGHALNHLLLDALQQQNAGRETTKTEGTAS
jgi:UDP-3-O-[3-hydroxymyristoyl] N-acetylglucosamine deacetylase/3-hydroxyacyl-[acyl-carrier-protein] dehydratase